MIVLTGHPFEWEVDGPTAVTIGVFDGVHRGHRRVLLDLADRARTARIVPAVLTFDPHPLTIVSPDRVPHMLTSLEQRLEQFRELGVLITGVLSFPDVRDLTPTEFARDVLAGPLQARRVVVGADFRYGRDRRGDVRVLAEEGGRLGFETEVVAMIDDGQGIVSSTRIRGLVSAGEVEQAAALLGRPYELDGSIVRGDRRGRAIGFPTANVEVGAERLVPGNGVYAGVARVAGHEGPAVANIGRRPTFDGVGRTIEVHILDVDQDLYGQRLAFSFHSRLRNEVRFASVDELVDQINRDVTRARAVLGNRGGE